MYSAEDSSAHSLRLWTLVALALTAGLVIGFAVPLASAYEPQKSSRPIATTLVIPTLLPPSQQEDPNSEEARLAARHRRREALIVTSNKQSDSAK